MSDSTLPALDAGRWRAEIAARLDRRWIGAASAYAAVLTAVIVVGDHAGHELPAFIFFTLFNFSTVLLTLAVLTVPLVAVAHGVSAWLAYPAACFAIAAIGTVLGIVIEANCGCPSRPLHAMVVGHLYGLSLLFPPGVLYVYASGAAYDGKVLRMLESERAAETDRLARQRLQTELASVDHDLILRGLRLALAVRARDDARADALLAAVSAYLRLAQQRGSSEPERIAAAQAELRQACASLVEAPAQQVIA